MEKIQIGIMGYGNLGRGVELAVEKSPDMELAGIFSRRSPEAIQPQLKNSKVFEVEKAVSMKAEIHVMILCGGSATDLMWQSPEFAKDFNIIDSFDTHAKIPEHVANVDKVARENGTVAILSVGWDPGLFSLNRLYSQSVLPVGKDYTFWGRGVSQGHSDAIRRIAGVRKAVQYTIPIEGAVEGARSGAWPEYSAREKHLRECFVVAEEGVDLDEIRKQIVTMPNYFSDYDTQVHFISEGEFLEKHAGMPHGGFVIRSGKTGVNEEHRHAYEFSLKLDSNPEFTASVLTAYARAAYRLSREGVVGARTILEIAPSLIASEDLSTLRKNLL